MKRAHIPKYKREFIRWSQKDMCLLCSFPLVLCCHFHHVVSVNDFGPENTLNLIGLCANHHCMLENLKKTPHPTLSITKSISPVNKKWSYKIDAAIKMIDTFAPEIQKLVNLFLERYPSSSKECLSNMFHDKEPFINVAIARKLIDKNVRLLKEVNRYRPRVYFIKPILNRFVSGFDPYDLTLLKVSEYQETIDLIVNTTLCNISDDMFDSIIAQQFIKMGFNYFTDDNNNINFEFSNRLSFTIKEIRLMSDHELFNLNISV